MTLASPITTIAYLGDSLTDSGQIFSLTQDAIGVGIPFSPIYDQQLSNGPVYADLVPELLGLSGGLNFAVGGASATRDRTIREYVENIIDDLGLGGIDSLYLDLLRLLSSDARAAQDTVMDLPGQTARLIDAVAPAARDSVAVSILIGANDIDYSGFGDIDPLALQAAIVDVATTVVAEIEGLLAAGFGTVLISTLPSGSFFPAVSAGGPLVDAAADQAAAFYNGLLEDYAATRDAVQIVDLGLMADEVAADISAFGFTNIEGSILPGSATGFLPTADALATPWDQFVFVDELHPTTQMHQIWSVFSAETLDSSYSTGTAADDDTRLTRGDDLHLGLSGNDVIAARSGDDVVLAGLGDDSVTGAAGSDVLSGGSGNDTLRGGGGDDLVVGNDGDDLLTGNRGNDVLIDGDGSDTVFGGVGDDVFIFTEAELFGGDSDDSDLFDGGGGSDTLVLQLTLPTLIEAELDQLFSGDGSAIFDDLGLTTRSIETFVFVGYGGVLDVLSLSGDQASVLEQADLWNFI